MREKNQVVLPLNLGIRISLDCKYIIEQRVADYFKIILTKNFFCIIMV